MIGLYGGTFDPVHYGHLRTALEVKEIFALDELRLIPCAQPAHRESPLTTPKMRVQMLTLAVKNQSGLIIDQRELERDGFSYMIDTVKLLSNEIPETPLLLFMGMDAFNSLTSWHQWQALFDYVHIVVITRPRFEPPILIDFFADRLTDQQENLQKKIAGFLFFQTVTPLDISATAIRHNTARGKNSGFLLPDCVINYIHQNKLYKN